MALELQQGPECEPALLVEPQQPRTPEGTLPRMALELQQGPECEPALLVEPQRELRRELQPQSPSHTRHTQDDVRQPRHQLWYQRLGWYRNVDRFRMNQDSG